MLLRHLDRRHNGEWRSLDEARARVLAEGQTLQCGHCPRMWELRPGSGIERGFCLKCNQPTCNQPGCTPPGECRPWEAQMEAMERRARLLESVRRNYQR